MIYLVVFLSLCDLSTFGMIKPIPTNIAGKIISHLYEHGLKITKMKKVRLTSDDVMYIYRSHQSDPTYP